MKKALIAAGVTAAALTGAQLYVLGSRGGIGPLRFIRNNKIAAHPGNGPEFTFENVKLMENSPLLGKHVCFLGSSVFYGAASNGEAIPEFISRRFGCTYTKETVSGTTLCDIAKSSYIRRLQKLDTGVHYDLFVCQLSTNDATRKLPLGAIGDGDTRTVTGALEFIVQYVRKTWNCPVVFIVGSRYDSPAYAAMRGRLLELHGKYGFGVVDLWGDDDFNNIDTEKRCLYMSDDIHPTKAGYHDWWGPEIERQLLKIWKNI